MTRAPAELRLVADRAAKALAAAGVPAAGDGVAVAVSGGADSLALLHALRALAGPRGWRLAVVTVDHGLRPGSAADAAFVADHAKALGLPARVRTLAPADLTSTARPAPRARPGRPGTAPCGRPPTSSAAAGWPPATPSTTRPRRCCCSCSGGQARTAWPAWPSAAAGCCGPCSASAGPRPGPAAPPSAWSWREDPTNAGDGPLRNRVRQRLLPLLEELRPGATRALARTAALAADERDWLDQLVADALAATLAGGVDSQAPPDPPWATLRGGAPTTRGAGPARLDAEALAALPVALARRVVRAAARQAGGPVPDAAATDRILGLPAD